AVALDVNSTDPIVAAMPGDDEVAGRVHGHRRVALVARGGDVDWELAAERHAGGGVAAGVDAVAAAVLGAVPNDDEVAIRVHRHRRHMLVAGGVGVDWELRALRHALGVV